MNSLTQCYKRGAGFLLLAGGFCVVRRRDSRRYGREEIPFGPFLAAGMGIACWWGEALWRWYVG